MFCGSLKSGVNLFKCLQYSHILTNEPRHDSKWSSVFLTLHKFEITTKIGGVQMVRMSMQNIDLAKEFGDNSYLE